ncbi:MAG: FG-GAP repeat protein, partial [Gammaproteobacteria bacterium]|nr:FG-GAP repeat protein [Gammaproteobacteria bacterium]
ETETYTCTLATTDQDPDTADVPGLCTLQVEIPLQLLSREMAGFQIEALNDGVWEEKLAVIMASSNGFAELVFGWTTSVDETSYRFFADFDGDADGDGMFEFVQQGGDLLADTETDDYRCTLATADRYGSCVYVFPLKAHLLDWNNVRFRVDSCIDTVCTELGQQVVRNLSTLFVTPLVNAGVVSAYADNVDRVVVGSPITSQFECEELFPVPADEVDDFCEYSEDLEGDEIPETLTETIVLAGSTSIFALDDDGVWQQEALIKASNIGETDAFGVDVAISDDGNTIVVAANSEDSNVVGAQNGAAIDNGGDNDDEVNSGAAYILTRDDTGTEPVWNEVAFLKPQNTDGDDTPDDESLDGDQFGSVVAISGDGLTVAVSSFGEDSNAMGIDGDGADNSAENSGAVYVFRNMGGTWMQEAYVKPSNTDLNDAFGSSLALSDDGNRLVVGAIRESSSASGVGGDAFNNGSTNSGAAYVFERSGSAWSEQAYLKASSPDARDEFGFSVALNGAGDLLVVGAPQEDSRTRIINGSQTNDEGVDRNLGAAYVFEESGGTWAQTAYLKAANADPVDEFGTVIAVAENGAETRVIVSSIREGGVQSGINPSDDLDSFIGSGAAYLFIRDGSGWRQQSYIKAPNNAPGILFGWDVDFADSGDRLAINSFGSSFQSATTYIY